MRTIVITGSESGLGLATKERLIARGDRVIGIDVHESADIVADLSKPEERRAAIEAVRELSGGVIDAFAPFAGVAGTATRPGALLVSINYFGTIELATALREMLARGTDPAVVVISSNTTTTTTATSDELIEACLAGDESAARSLGDEVGSMAAYPITKTALVRWARRNATSADWIGAGIRLNAIAPGVIETPLTDESKADPIKGPVFDKFPVPAGRLGRPEEIAALTEFLLGPEARFFVGSLIFCDGGTDAVLRPDAWPMPATHQLFG